LLDARFRREAEGYVEIGCFRFCRFADLARREASGAGKKAPPSRVRPRSAFLEGGDRAPNLENCADNPTTYRGAVPSARLPSDLQEITGDELLAFTNHDKAARPDGKRGAGLFAYLPVQTATTGTM
jgi:hypothetical protein